MSSLLTLKMGMAVVQGGRDDKGEREGCFFFFLINYFIFKIGLMPRTLVNKLSQDTIPLDKKDH